MMHRKELLLKGQAKTTLVLSLLLLQLLCSSYYVDAAADDIPLCCLCDDCKSALSGRNHMPVRTDGTTCDDIILELADPTNDSTWRSDTCSRERALYYDRCCNPYHCPEPITVVTQEDEQKYDTYKDNHPPCQICGKSGKFPQRPKTITASLNLPGNPTCEDLYWIGKVGGISDQYCKPMQHFFKEPCGCDLEEVDSPGVFVDYSCIDKEEAPIDKSIFSDQSTGSGATFGGAPESDWEEVEDEQGSDLDGLYPPKKTVGEEDDLTDEDKLFQGDNRGGLHRLLRGRQNVLFQIVKLQK